MRFIKLLSIPLFAIAICSTADAGAGASGGTSVIMCVIDAKQVNVPLEYFETSFNKIPGHDEFTKFIKWYSDRNSNLGNYLGQINDSGNIHWSWVPKSCDANLLSSNPELPILANFGVYYDGAEAVAFEQYFPTVLNFQLISIVHEAVRFTVCGSNDVCTRFISETLLDKYQNDSGISAAGLEKFFDDSVERASRQRSTEANNEIYATFVNIVYQSSGAWHK